MALVGPIKYPRVLILVDLGIKAHLTVNREDRQDARPLGHVERLRRSLFFAEREPLDNLGHETAGCCRGEGREDTASCYGYARPWANSGYRMAKQAATTSNKNVAKPMLDLTYGFPGKVPSNVKYIAFLLKYVETGEVMKSALAVGYSRGWGQGTAPRVLDQYKDMVVWLQAARAQAVAKTIEIDQDRVLREMVSIAFANEADFIVIEDVVVEGKTVKRARRKEVEELTREQLAAVVVIKVRGKADRITWKWRDRDGKLFEIGKHLGMFNEKIIMEHRHRHTHRHFDLSKVPLDRLEAIEGEFEEMMGDESDARG